MKKIFVTVAVLAVFSSFTFLFGNPLSEEKEMASGMPAQKAGNRTLVTFFTSPGTDGVDASSGASRVVSDFKLYGATEYVAKIISETTGGELFQIKTTHTYPTRIHKELVDHVKHETESKIYPKIATKIPHFDDYDVVFVGYPIWWYDMPMVIYTLFNEYDFSGKTIVPFCTHGGSGFAQSVKTIVNMEKNAKVVRGPAISRDKVPESRDGLVKWLQEQGFVSK